jgi:hypothetical protein
MVALAKGGQVIHRGDGRRASAELRGKVREVDVLTVKGKEKDIVIMELVWQDSADLTTLTTRPKLRAARLESRARRARDRACLPRWRLRRPRRAERRGDRRSARVADARTDRAPARQARAGRPELERHLQTVDGEGEIQLRCEGLMQRGRAASASATRSGRSCRDSRLRVHRRRRVGRPP